MSLAETEKAPTGIARIPARPRDVANTATTTAIARPNRPATAMRLATATSLATPRTAVIARTGTAPERGTIATVRPGTARTATFKHVTGKTVRVSRATANPARGRSVLMVAGTTVGRIPGGTNARSAGRRGTPDQTSADPRSAARWRPAAAVDPPPRRRSRNVDGAIPAFGSERRGLARPSL